MIQFRIKFKAVSLKSFSLKAVFRSLSCKQESLFDKSESRSMTKYFDYMEHFRRITFEANMIRNLRFKAQPAVLISNQKS